MNRPRITYALVGTLLLTTGIGLGIPAHQLTTAQASTLPAVTVTGVMVNNSSAKIDFMPVPGAQDYRVYDLSNLSTVKYAGLRSWSVPDDCTCHFALAADGKTPIFPLQVVPNSDILDQPTEIHGPNTEIEWNMLEDGKPHTLRVEALNTLGPLPPANAAKVTLANGVLPVMQPLPSYAMIGANEGQTPNGNTSINGQGPSTNAPGVIAQSAPFVVQADPAQRPIPSRPDAKQTFLDTFDDSEMGSLHRQPTSPSSSDVEYTINEGTPLASTFEVQTDVTSTVAATVMIEAGHLMDIVPSAGGSGIHSTFSPVSFADFGNGQVLHATMEVDAPNSNNRWVQFHVQPALDTGQGDVTVQFVDQHVEIDESYPTPGSGDGMGSSSVEANRMNINWGGNGRGIDNRSRFDLFMTTQHYAVFEDGQLVTQGDFAGPLGFTVAQIQYQHFFYHSDMAVASILQGSDGLQAEQASELQYNPWNVAQVSDYPFTDERHWDNIGFEVLPAAPANWSTLASLIHMPASTAPVPPAQPSSKPHVQQHKHAKKHLSKLPGMKM